MLQGHNATDEVSVTLLCTSIMYICTLLSLCVCCVVCVWCVWYGVWVCIGAHAFLNDFFFGLREHNLRSVAIPCVHSLKRGYPVDEGAHIAISECWFPIFSM